MKKITKLSLAACLAFSSSMYADTLEKALSDSKIKGEIKVQYFSVQPVTDGKSDSITAIGGNLNLVTGSFYGLKAGVTFQTSHIPDISVEGANDFKNTMDASGSVMSEAYLSYTMDKTTAKIGRQYISTPLVAGSDSRMIKESFEGATIVNTNLADTTIMAGYISKFQGRTDGAGSPGKFNKYKDGAWTLYVKNNSIEDLTIQAQYLKEKGETANTDMTGQYLDATYKIGGLTVAGQYMGSETNDVNSSLLAAKISGNVGFVNLTGIYSTTGNKGTVDPGIGAGADSSFTTLPLHGGSVTYTNNTDTIVGIAATRIAGATVAAYYGVVNADKKAGLPYEEIKAHGGFVQYAFNKNFSAKVMYESADFDTMKNDDNILRVYTSYKF